MKHQTIQIGELEFRKSGPGEAISYTCIGDNNLYFLLADEDGYDKLSRLFEPDQGQTLAPLDVTEDRSPAQIVEDGDAGEVLERLYDLAENVIGLTDRIMVVESLLRFAVGHMGETNQVVAREIMRLCGVAQEDDPEPEGIDDPNIEYQPYAGQVLVSGDDFDPFLDPDESLP